MFGILYLAKIFLKLKVEKQLNNIILEPTRIDIKLCSNFEIYAPLFKCGETALMCELTSAGFILT